MRRRLERAPGRRGIRLVAGRAGGVERADRVEADRRAADVGFRSAVERGRELGRPLVGGQRRRARRPGPASSAPPVAGSVQAERPLDAVDRRGSPPSDRAVARQDAATFVGLGRVAGRPWRGSRSAWSRPAGSRSGARRRRRGSRGRPGSPTASGMPWLSRRNGDAERGAGRRAAGIRTATGRRMTAMRDAAPSATAGAARRRAAAETAPDPARTGRAGSARSPAARACPRTAGRKVRA